MNAQLNIPQHPLLQLFRPIVATRSIEGLADAINSALDMGYRGLGVYGFARFGKTEAMTYLIAHTEWLRERVAALICVDAPDTHKRTDSSFYKTLLTLLGVRIPPHAAPDELCALVMGRLIENCQKAGSRLVIVFIDEAQRLMPTDYENLVTLDNRMTRAGYYFFTVFIHQRDISGFSNEVIAGNDHPPHVSGRFLVRRHEFCGLRDIEETAYVLARYDEGSEWPPGSGISYTQHFAQQAFSGGFRMAQCAALLWETASNLRAQARLPEEWSWPMKSFEGAVVYLLTTIASRTHQFERFTDDDFAEALYAAGLVELELSRHTYKPQGVK